MKGNLKERKGITLIALVVTIIILLILAGVTIYFAVNSGLIEKTQEAKNKSEQATQNELNTLNEIYGELNRYLPNEETVENISKTESYVGYYADINADGTVDGIIYADLAKGNTGDGQWYDSDGNYTIPVAEGVKDYYISKTNYEGSFGTKDVLSPTGTGKDRFYIMALTDIDGKRNGTLYDWYNAAYGNMSDYATATSGDFGTGKANTNAMIAKWDAKAYGEQDQSTNNKDMWGQIKSQVANGWFVPSRAEWSAFAEELGITKENYANKGLSDDYWSSAQYDTFRAFNARFGRGYMDFGGVYNGGYVRLSATF
ncbi:MAG: type II secretion system protein [Clostridia bacterium]